MKIALVLNPENSGWIIEKFALRLESSLTHLGHEVQITQKPVNDVDVNHFMSYNFVSKVQTVSTVMVTHIDDALKMKHLRKLIEKYNICSLICMSADTVNLLVENEIPQNKISYVLPAVDSLPELKRIKIGLSGRIYKDGRKNEKWLTELAKQISFENFEFHIFGTGWEAVSSSIVDAGGLTVIYPETKNYLDDHLLIISSFKNLDYWLYLGFDEGSMGCLDASLAGLPLIATPQGFHLELPTEIAFPVENMIQLKAIMRKLESPFRNLNTLRDYWLWDRYAQEHLSIWSGNFNYRPLWASPKHSHRGSIKISYRTLTLRRVLSGIGRSELFLILRNLLRPGKK